MRREQRIVLVVAAAVLLLTLGFVGRQALARYELVGIRPYRCRFVGGSVPMDVMHGVGLATSVDWTGVDAPSGALASVDYKGGFLVAARLRRDDSHADLGIGVWQLDARTRPAAVNALARRWSRVDAPVSETGGVRTKVVTRCLADDKYP